MMLSLYIIGSLIALIMLSLRLRDICDELEQVTDELEQVTRERDTCFWIIHAAQLRPSDLGDGRRPEE
jgi:hypothetical protein